MNLRFHHVNYRRIFAIGEEPSRVRVTAYRKPCALRHIFNALDPDEVERIRGSQFGRMLQKKTVNDKEIRLKYAYLSLLAAVILPTTHTPRISHDQAELIKDLDAFLAFPRGRVSFDMLMTSIKERKEVALLQNTIALKVMIEAVPALTGVVQDGSSSGSEDESGEADGDILDDDKSDKKSIHPGHARDIDSEGKAVVHSIIPDDNNIVNTADGVAWSDDKDETIVENLVNLVEERFPFSQTCFPGGVSIVEAFRMRDEAKAEAVNRKNSKPKATSSTIIQEGVDP
ncbi:hypothetical protein HID58_009149 [Brassica napus]|uniref:DUF1985 domain-containing protein n=1 Tax=Brassica napus TaxID=3708 RepID=A0ABQ8DSH2_BRANA|nr:hypothetical protein HID58_009149 [Brassica napus]